MKTTARVMLGTVCIWLTGMVTAFGVNYTFESNTTGWTLGGGAARTSTGAPFGTLTTGWAVSVPALGSASSPSVTPGASSEITDFWTKPNPVTAAPAIGDDASVQFAFDPVVGVRVLDGAGWTTASAQGATVDGTVWLHVTVIKSESTWTLKVNGATIGTYGLHAAGSPQTAWFSVANGAGTAAAMLDDVSVLDNSSSALTAAADNKDASISSVDASGTDLAGTTTAGLAYQVKASDDYAGTVNVRTLSLSGSGTTRSFTDTLLSSKDNIYYRLVLSADGGATIGAESNPSFVVHKQDRSGAAGSSYWVGSMINYASGNDNLSTGAALANQMKTGLTGGDDVDTGDNVIVYSGTTKTTYWLNGDGNWMTGVSTPAGTDPIPVGSAFLIQTKNPGSSTKAVFAGPQIDNTVSSFTHDVPAGWFMFSYPLEGTKTIASLTGGVATGDLMYLYRGGSYKLLKKFASGWRTYTGGALPAGYTDLQFGEGVFYYSPGTTLTLK